jgi:hypothetical protein
MLFILPTDLPAVKFFPRNPSRGIHPPTSTGNPLRGVGRLRRSAVRPMLKVGSGRSWLLQPLRTLLGSNASFRPVRPETRSTGPSRRADLPPVRPIVPPFVTFRSGFRLP